MAKNKGGRPRKYNTKQVEEIKEKLIQYIDNNEIPIVVEFAYLNDISRDNLYDYPEFSTLLKKLIMKKESNLERGLLKGKLNAAGAIFSLKQLGWKDKHDHSHEGEIKVTILKELEQDYT